MHPKNIRFYIGEMPKESTKLWAMVVGPIIFNSSLQCAFTYF